MIARCPACRLMVEARPIDDIAVIGRRHHPPRHPPSRVEILAHGSCAGVGAAVRYQPMCGGCGHEIDPGTCWCGGSREGHGNPMDEGHDFVPDGCECLHAEFRAARCATCGRRFDAAMDACPWCPDGDDEAGHAFVPEGCACDGESITAITDRTTSRDPEA